MLGEKSKVWQSLVFLWKQLVILADADFILSGLLTLILGPIVALGSSWLLYAFGELVEKASQIEFHTKIIAAKTL